MRGLKAAAVALGLLCSAQAHATTGLEWKWDVGTERTYLLQAQVRLSEMMLFKGQQNQDLRVVEFYVAAVSTCRSVDEIGKKAWELRCSFSDVQLTAAPPEIEAGRGLVEVLDEYDELIRGGELQIVFGRDGKLRNVDLEGVDNRIRRLREIQEVLRLVLLRAFAGLELELPKNGDDGGTAWRQTSSMALQLPKATGTMGGVRLDSAVTASDGSEVTIETSGKGTVSSGETVGAPGAEVAKNMFELEMRGSAEFDTSQGTLVSRDYLVAGEPTASSALATGVAGAPYVQAVHVELIPPGAKVAPLEGNAETKPGESGI